MGRGVNAIPFRHFSDGAANGDSSVWRVAALTMMPGKALERALSGTNAQSWIQAAAQCGIVEAQLRLAQMLLDGAGLPKDEKAAFDWISRAAATGDADALNMLGRCHENGWGTARAFERAAVCFRHAADKGHAWAQYNLGHLLLDGSGIARNQAEAFAWYFRAAQQGHARAMNLVARCLEKGWGIDADIRTARNWYRKSAEGGYFRGQYNYAMILADEGCAAGATHWAKRAMDGAPEPTASNMRAALSKHPRAELRALVLQANRSKGRPITRASCSSSARLSGNPPP